MTGLCGITLQAVLGALSLLSSEKDKAFGQPREYDPLKRSHIPNGDTVTAAVIADGNVLKWSIHARSCNLSLSREDLQIHEPGCRRYAKFAAARTNTSANFDMILELLSTTPTH